MNRTSPHLPTRGTRASQSASPSKLHGRRGLSGALLAGLALFVTAVPLACARRAGGAEAGPAAATAGPRARVASRTAQAVYDSVRRVLDAGVASGAFPGAWAAVGTPDGVVAVYGAGQLDSADATRPDANTVWDLASLTKVIGTTSAVARLVADGAVALDTPVVRYLPQWTARGAERVTVRHLLTHSSGLPAWRALYKEAATREEALTQVFATAPDTLPGLRFVYSDLGFILLGQLVERVSGTTLADFEARQIFGPLGMRETRFLPPSTWLARTAPTERDPWRQRHLRGEVHDENAHRLGGVSGHAGLFSTGRDLVRFARMYLNHGRLDGVRVLDSATLATFTRVQDSSVSRRALGWETPTGGNSAGRRLSARAFGHTGFTGTSLWMDPEQQLFVLLLTNRVNPTRESRGIGTVRTALADAVSQAMASASTSLSPSSSPSAAGTGRR